MKVVESTASAPDEMETSGGGRRSVDVRTALTVFGSPIRMTYLEQIAVRPGTFEGLRRRAWGVPQHLTILRRLQAASWIARFDGVYRLRPDTVRCIREHIFTLVMKASQGQELEPHVSAASKGVVIGGPLVDARVMLARLSSPGGWDTYEAIALGADKNAELTRELRVQHSLVSYHVRHLIRAGMIECDAGHGIRVVRSGLLELYSYLGLLEEGWPYRPGAVAANTQALHARNLLRLS